MSCEKMELSGLPYVMECEYSSPSLVHALHELDCQIISDFAENRCIKKMCADDLLEHIHAMVGAEEVQADCICIVYPGVCYAGRRWCKLDPGLKAPPPDFSSPKFDV